MEDDIPFGQKILIQELMDYSGKANAQSRGFDGGLEEGIATGIRTALLCLGYEEPDTTHKGIYTDRVNRLRNAIKNSLVRNIPTEIEAQAYVDKMFRGIEEHEKFIQTHFQSETITEIVKFIAFRTDEKGEIYPENYNAYEECAKRLREGEVVLCIYKAVDAKGNQKEIKLLRVKVGKELIAYDADFETMELYEAIITAYKIKKANPWRDTL